MTPFLPLYNPNLLDDTTFLRGFVARDELAELLLQKLNRMTDETPTDVQLIVGQTGMGKTSLLRRIEIGVAEDTILHERYLPLRLREEQYNVLGLVDFWRNAARSLAEWCEQNAPRSQFPAVLNRKWTSPEWRDAETVLDALLATAKQLDLRLLLLVDNLDSLLDAISPNGNWVLRRALQAPGGPAMIAAATRLPPQSGDRASAFYEFFRLHMLEPLRVDEAMAFVRRLAETRGEDGKAVIRVLDLEPRRLRTIYAFTGGSPRVLALIYRVIESQATHEASEDLDAIFDQLTPYCKSRIEAYATPQQRAVIDALALNWDPITSHELAGATGIVVTTISSQLSRMRKDGLIKEVEVAGARAGYQMADRPFSIWYMMRRGGRRTRTRVICLAKFLVTAQVPCRA